MSGPDRSCALAVGADLAQVRALAGALGRRGLPCQEEAGAPAALLRLRRHPGCPLLAIMDPLPGLGSVGLLRLARTLPGFEALPVLLVGTVNAPALPGVAWAATPDDPGLATALTALALDNRTAPTALVADDNLINRRVATAVASDLGYAVLEAADGAQALALLADQGPCPLVLMDIDMPVMDGWAATAELRRLEAERGWPRSLVVAITGHPCEDAAARDAAAGIDARLLKPFAPEALAALVRQGRCGAPRPVAPPPPGEDDLPILDAAVQARIRSYGQAIADELATTFRREVGERTNLARSLLAAGDLAALARLAHTAKGSTGTYGAKRLSRAWAALEAAAKAGRTDAGPLLDRVEQEGRAALLAG